MVAGYCCPLTANTYGIEFDSFRIRDYDSQQLLFEVAKDPNAPPVDMASIPPEMEDQVRSISYDFGSGFLDYQTIGTTLQFSVGAEEVQNFRMIERHYFRDYLIKSFDFSFGFCIPNSTNTWEAIYDMPELPANLIEDMCASLPAALHSSPVGSSPEVSHARPEYHTSQPSLPPRPATLAPWFGSGPGDTHLTTTTNITTPTTTRSRLAGSPSRTRPSPTPFTTWETP